MHSERHVSDSGKTRHAPVETFERTARRLQNNLVSNTGSDQSRIDLLVLQQNIKQIPYSMAEK